MMSRFIGGTDLLPGQQVAPAEILDRRAFP
jgi:hypothetical protein